jgi:fructose-1,6-bisphosphatase/sedoheptulose 1,7-bisphosphatase-like protein
MNRKEAEALREVMEDRARDMAHAAQEAMGRGDRAGAQRFAASAARNAHNAQAIEGALV